MQDYRQVIKLCENSAEAGPRAKDFRGENKAGPIKHPIIYRQLISVDCARPPAHLAIESECSDVGAGQEAVATSEIKRASSQILEKKGQCKARSWEFGSAP